MVTMRRWIVKLSFYNYIDFSTQMLRDASNLELKGRETLLRYLFRNLLMRCLAADGFLNCNYFPGHLQSLPLSENWLRQGRLLYTGTNNYGTVKIGDAV